jgi:hypothetical protein
MEISLVREDGVSLGFVEGLNNKIRVIQRCTYGLRDEKYLRLKRSSLMCHYNEERLHTTLGYMMPATWHRGQPNEVREERARRTAAARVHRKLTNQQRLNAAA